MGIHLEQIGLTPLDAVRGAPVAVVDRFQERMTKRDEERLGRRHRARQKAAQIVTAAIESADAEHDAFGEIARRVATTLGTERCDLLWFLGEEDGVIYRVRDGAEPGPARAVEDGNDRDAISGTARGRLRIEFVRLSERQSPLDLLRDEGRVDRVHVFISQPGNGTRLGILSVESPATRRFSVDERALLDAVVDLLSAVMVRGETAPNRDAVALQTSVS